MTRTKMNILKNNNIWFLVASLIFLAIVFYFFTDIISYVLISFVLSLMGQPFMRIFLKKLGLKRFRFGSAVSALLTLSLFIFLFVLFISMFVPIVVQQALFLRELDYGAISQTLEIPFQWVENYLTKLGVDVEHNSSEELVRDMLGGVFDPNKIGDFFSSMLSFASEFIMGIFSVLFISFFFLQEQGMFQSFILALVPTEHESKVKAVMDDTIALLIRYFSGIMIQMVIITLYVSIFLSILGIKNALLIGFVAAITNIIPYLGPLIGGTFGVLVTISANGDSQFYTELIPMMIKVVGVFASMQLIDNFILQPVIFSTSVKAHPLEIFIVILLAAKLGGVLGMVLAVPVYTMLRVVASNFLSEFKIVQRLTKGIQN
jgi:predicted PurR-regulated permease PerM